VRTLVRCAVHRSFFTIEGSNLRGGRVGAGTRADEFVGGYAKNVFRRPYGDGWALVGDAGSSYEFTTGHGITNAFRQAAQIAEAIDQGLDGQRPTLCPISRSGATKWRAPFTTSRTTRSRSSRRAQRFSCLRQFTRARTRRTHSSGKELFAQTINPPEFFSPTSLSKLIGA
jgi:flavin-dependent dehydrogenase